jgi:hypothetical protein
MSAPETVIWLKAFLLPVMTALSKQDNRVALDALQKAYSAAMREFNSNSMLLSDTEHRQVATMLESACRDVASKVGIAASDMIKFQKF